MRRIIASFVILALNFCVYPAFLYPASAQTSVQKSFVNDDLASDAVRLEEQVKKDGATYAGRPFDQLHKMLQTAITQGNTTYALQLASSLIALEPKDADLWAGYARLKIKSADNYTVQQAATTAAYIAYQRAASKADEAAALALLGEIYAKREMWRPSLNAYRASLDLADVPAIRSVYEKERESYGFRILEYKVDNESTAPRVCFQFSESLAHGRVDFAPFVSVGGMSNAAISTDDQQLCVEGLRHGNHYQIGLRQGLPSAVGESLLKAAEYDVYVRDRSPQVHFVGKSYILPRIGQEGIPVVSVNTRKIAVDIIRIGDRNLLPTVRSSDFLAQLSSYRIKQFIENDGRKIWSGTLAAASELNQDVTTAFPVLDAVGKLEAGVYLMIAKPGDGQAAASADDEEGGGTIASQWFVVSDLGLTALNGTDGIHVFARSLATAQPIEGVSFRLIARDNEVLATKASDRDGHVAFDAGLARGTGGQAPGILVAENGKGDYGFLDLEQTAFDLTDRGVKGRPAVQALDAFLYTERGVYRSGETVFITALLRDEKGIAKPGLPLTLVVKRPDGVEYKRTQLQDQADGGRLLELPLLSGVATGTWRIEAFVDPKGNAIGATSFLVEDYVPERLEFTITPAQGEARLGEESKIATQARYLYGAPGANLEISGEVQVRAAGDTGLPALLGYEAGLQDESFETVTNEIEDKVTTDAKGAAEIAVPIPEVTAARPLVAKIILRAGEPGGRAVERTVTLPILPKSGLIGVKKNFDSLGQGSTASFDVIAVGTDGKRAARKGVSWSLYKINQNYQWYKHDGRWNYEEVKSTRRVAEGKLDLTTDAPAKIASPVELGTYRLDVKSDNGSDAPTSVTFYAGWSGDTTSQTPDLLEVTLDKADYKPGEDMRVRINSRFAGTATVAILGEAMHASTLVDLKAGENMATLRADAGWGSGAYAVVLAHRPLDQAARRMPGRALGLVWFGIDRDAHKLDVSMQTPDKVRPRETMNVPVTIAGLAAGEEAHVTLAAVDVGILSLTRYEAPNPTAYLYGQRQLGTEIRDIYGQLIDGMQGTRGEIRSGGDAGGNLDSNRPTQKPLALFSGIVKVGADGKAAVNLDLPAFNGSVRLMAVAWTKTKVGSASKDVIVRDPVVIQATLPRFLALGDRSRLHLDIDNVEGQSGDYVFDVDVHGPVSMAADALHGTIKLAAAARSTLAIPLTAAGVGTASLDVKLTGPGLSATQSYAINIEPGTSQLYRRVVRTLAPGESLTVSDDLVAEYLPGTGSVSVTASALSGIDVAALLQSLDRYPYGCSEQIVSRAMPLLYVNKLANLEALAIDANIADRIKGAIDRLLTRQDSNGAFGLWSADGADDMWLHAFVTDFLTRARENGFAVPQKAFDLALERLRNHIANTSEVEAGQSASLAYAAYVLARNGRPVMGDLRYLADTQIASFDSPLARAQIGAALALLGDRGRAAHVFTAAGDALASFTDQAYSRPDYGSRLRDGAALLALVAEAGVSPNEIARTEHVLESARSTALYTSTQENTWMVLAAEALAEKSQAEALTIDGTPHTGAFYRTWVAQALEGKASTITNAGQSPARIVVTAAGNPYTPGPATQQGYQVERTYYTLSGKKIDPQTPIKQNDRFVVALTVTETEAAYARLLLNDPLPAGLEIDNPDLFEGGSVEDLGWLKKTVEPNFTEYRDDRFTAAFDRNGSDKATFTLAYVVRAVTPGHYIQPPLTVEDMYRPQRFGRSAYGAIDVVEAK
jgi:alpha-2-macroglobulin